MSWNIRMNFNMCMFKLPYFWQRLKFLDEPAFKPMIVWSSNFQNIFLMYILAHLLLILLHGLSYLYIYLSIYLSILYRFPQNVQDSRCRIQIYPIYLWNAPIGVELVKLVGNVHLSIRFFIKLVTTTPSKRLNGISWNFQEIFL